MFNRRLSSALVWWVGVVSRHAWVATLLCVATAAWSVYYSANNLGISTDTAEMFSPDLTWRKDRNEYKAAFPSDVDNLIIVIDGNTPELASRASRILAERLRKESAIVDSVRQPGAGAFFETHALLYLDADELQDLSEQLIEVQPFLGTLSRDPSIVGISALLREIVDARETDVRLDLVPVLRAISEAAEASIEARFFEVSWQELLLDRASRPDERRRFVVVKPHLDWTTMFPAEAAIQRIRELIEANALTAEQGVRVRITGAQAMEHEELETVVRGTKLAGLLALVMVTIVLVVGLGSLRLVVASIVTLLVGLSVTAAFATAAVGHLNLISVAFAVLYIGLGIDYAIHYCLRYRELVNLGRDQVEALCESAGDVGGSLALCAVTTGIGFYAFVPTDFQGVSELGLISGTGMFISLAASLTALPALLTLMPLSGASASPRAVSDMWRRLTTLPYAHRRSVLAGAVVLAVLASGLAPMAWFDGNPVNLRDPKGESAATFLELLADADPSPWPVIVLVKDAEEARGLAHELDALDSVSETRILGDFIPSEQDVKLALIEELDLALGLDTVERASLPRYTEAERLQALASLIETLRKLDDDPEAKAESTRLRRALTALTATSLSDRGARLERFERGVVGGLEEQLRLLRMSMLAEPIDIANLPGDLVERWVTANGRQRLEAYTDANLGDWDALNSFLDTVRSIAPNGTGSSVAYVEASKAVVGAFKEAFMLAFILIATIVWLVLRRLRYVFDVLAPLLLTAAVTVAVMVIIGIPFNFANVIALPLLLGIGVDNGIHMVYRMRSAPPATGNLLETSTARGVVISGLTTICSFGNLAFSPHPGTASMGIVLSIGVGITLLSTLVLTPALLAREHDI